MTDYLLRHALNDSDIEFLNETTVDFEIVGPNEPVSETNAFDSGWCDMATNARIIAHTNRAVFRNVGDQEYTYLKLRYQDRLIELHDGIRRIYNIT